MKLMTASTTLNYKKYANRPRVKDIFRTTLLEPLLTFVNLCTTAIAAVGTYEIYFRLQCEQKLNSYCSLPFGRNTSSVVVLSAMYHNMYTDQLSLDNNQLQSSCFLSVCVYVCLWAMCLIQINTILLLQTGQFLGKEATFPA